MCKRRDLAVIRVKVHTILGLKEILGGREMEIALSRGSTLQALISHMVARWGERLSSRLFEPGSSNLLPRIRVMVNGRDIGFIGGMETVLQEGDEIVIFPPVAGG
jgi:molybdopterin synthase sulfur carrier subunit